MTKKLLAVAPAKASSDALGLLIRRAAQTPGAASDLAFDLMAEDLGTRGPDLLYELSQGESASKEASQRAKERAEALLQNPKVQALFSPALRVAIELSQAPSCSARLPLLDRAKALGDERSLQVLTPLAAGTKRGCGKWKHLPCPATCQDEASAYLAAIRAISTRRGGTQL